MLSFMQFPTTDISVSVGEMSEAQWKESLPDVQTRIFILSSSLDLNRLIHTVESFKCVCGIKIFASKLFRPGIVFIHMGSFFFRRNETLTRMAQRLFFLINGINFL